MNEPLRIGMLGCATTAEYSIFKAIRQGAPITVAAIAARNPARAATYAQQRDIPEVYPDYQSLLTDAQIDAVYVPLANALHHRWTLAALDCGHHVLCEKPFALNATQATEMVLAAEQRDRVLMEAFHWRAHPLARRIEALLEDNAIGQVERIDCWFESSFGNVLPDDIRLSPELGGGVLLDMGCYCVDFVRMVAGDDIAVASAQSRPLQNVDGAVTAELLVAGGATARVHVEMDRPGHDVSSGARLKGSQGTLLIDNLFLPGWSTEPEWTSRITLTRGSETIVEEPGGLSSYFYQAQVFADLVRAHDSVPSPARSAIANMRVLDGIRDAAGLAPLA